MKIAELPDWAREIVEEGRAWSISDIADFQGVKLAKLRWADEE